MKKVIGYTMLALFFVATIVCYIFFMPLIATLIFIGFIVLIGGYIILALYLIKDE